MSAVEHLRSVVERIPEYKRLLYCSSVSPQAKTAGELLVYRHLRARPRERLMVVTPDQKRASADLQPAISVSVARPPRWVQRFRRNIFWSAADRLCGDLLKARFAEQADQFRPESVCSVLLPDSLLTAAASYAKERNLPLVLFCHDDYANFTSCLGRRYLANIYRQAAVKLCVSNIMEQE